MVVAVVAAAAAVIEIVQLCNCNQWERETSDDTDAGNEKCGACVEKNE